MPTLFLDIREFINVTANKNYLLIAGNSYATRNNPRQNLKDYTPDSITTINVCQSMNLIYKQFDAFQDNNFFSPQSTGSFALGIIQIPSKHVNQGKTT